MSFSIRRFLEISLGPIVLHRRVAGFRPRVIMCVSARVGGLKYLFRPFSRLDPELVRIVQRLVTKDSSVWDVGANVGIFSVLSGLLAGAGGSVVSFEADTDAVSLLNKTVYANGKLIPMQVVPIAISSSIGFLRFAIAKRARASNSIAGFGHSQAGGTREIRIVPSFTLDSMMEYFPLPSVLKIDVEGAELEVLKGASILLQTIRPSVYCEVGESTINQVSDILQEAGYKIYDAADFSVGLCTSYKDTTSNIVAIHFSKE